jgi:hypothetical protein
MKFAHYLNTPVNGNVQNFNLRVDPLDVDLAVTGIVKLSISLNKVFVFEVSFGVDGKADIGP